MTLDWSTIKSVALYVMGLVLVVLGALTSVSLPSGVHAAFVVVGTVILAIERYVQGNIAVAKLRAGK